MQLTIKKTKNGIRFKFILFNLAFVFSFVNLRDKAYTTGIRNVTENNKRLLFLDYDSQSLDLQILPEIKYLQEVYKLGDAFLFESSENSYHVIFFDELDFLEWLKILEKTSCDSIYKNVAYFGDNASNVLRVADKGEKKKPQYRRIIRGCKQSRKMDRGLYNFFNLLYNFPIYYSPEKFNNTKKVIKIDYLTLNKTKQ